MPYIIVDLDNCISDDAWRRQHIDTTTLDGFEKYRVYHLLAGFDIPNFDIPKFGDIFERSPDAKIIIFTARPIFFAPIALKWMQHYGIKYHQTYFRPMEASEFNSVQLKKLFLETMLEHHEIPLSDIEFAYDDRPDVLKMYRDKGLNAEMKSIKGVFNAD